jgi:acyl-CoA hydrolase
MNTDTAFEDTVLARIDAILEAAVEQGQAPGVVAAVARGDTVHVATAGVMVERTSQDLTVVVLTQHAADTGLPAVCEDMLTAIRAAG